MIEFGSQSPSPRRSRILVADDTDSIRALYRKLLATDGHEVIDVGDGEAALAAVHKHHPDVVLLDVTMPQLDGLERGDAVTDGDHLVAVAGQELAVQRTDAVGVVRPQDAATPC